MMSVTAVLVAKDGIVMMRRGADRHLGGRMCVASARCIANRRRDRGCDEQPEHRK